MRQVTLLVGITSFLSCHAFYQPKLEKDLPEVRPKTINELRTALFNDVPTKVIIDKVFDFTKQECKTTEVGCYQRDSSKQCQKRGQKTLNVNNRCEGLIPTMVTFDPVGVWGVFVGSNKVIQGENGGGLKGAGLLLRKSQDVEIRNLSITDINPRYNFGGDALNLWNVHNVLIDSCFIKNIGRQMVVTHFGACTGVTISNTVFDGITPYSDNCKGNHAWLWLFRGEGDRITLQNNVITGTAGRGPSLNAPNGSKSLVHIIQNVFFNVVDKGLVSHGDNKSSIMCEGNVFVSVSKVVLMNKGNIYLPQNAADAEACVSILGRKCLINTMVNSGGTEVNNSVQAIQDFGAEKDLLTKPIDMKSSINSHFDIPDYVMKHIQ